MQKNFLMNSNLIEMFNLGTDEEAGKAIKAIFALANKKEIPKLEGMALAIFVASKLQIENGWKLQEKRSKATSSIRTPIKTTKDNNSNNTEIKEISTEVIKLLNAEAKTSFKPDSKATLEKIKARLDDGFVLEDFKKVIKIKVNNWKDDDKMVGFLRPTTLFSSKFESYLNEPIINKSNKKTNSLNEDHLTNPDAFANQPTNFDEYYAMENEV